MGVVLIEIVHDGGLQFADAFEHAASDALVGYQAEETFDLVEPGCRGRRKVHVEAGMLGQPRLDGRMLVGGVVVGDQVQVERLGRGPVDGPQEFEPFLMAMHWPMTLPVATSSAANSVVVPWRL